jgi:predicted N-acetyltransferase YhbS
MDDMNLEYLQHHVQHIPTLARWHHEQWSYLNPQRTLEERAERLQLHVDGRQMPTTIVAIEDGLLLGSASLIENDLPTRTDLSPWLASVYVPEEHRRRGIGSALVRRIVEEAKALDYKMLYLFTMDRESLYAGLGWTTFERDVFNVVPIVLMSYDLGG